MAKLQSSAEILAESLTIMPDGSGHFGPYGGRFVAETLMGPLEELELAYHQYAQQPEFLAEFEHDLKQYVGRPSPLYHARHWSEKLGGAQIYLKREDLNHTGAHKVNNTVGQALLRPAHGQAAHHCRDRRPVSTGSPRPRSRPVMAWNVSSIWGRKISGGSPATCLR